MSKFSYHKFIEEKETFDYNFDRAYIEGERLGQHYYMKLKSSYPELAKKIKGSSIDPYYRDFKIVEFMEFLYSVDGKDIEDIDIK